MRDIKLLTKAGIRRSIKLANF